MKVYSYEPDTDNFDSYSIMPYKDLVDIHYADRILSHNWRPRLLSGFTDNPGKTGDFPTLNSYSRLPIISERAWECFKPLIGKSCEILPVIHPDGGQFHLLHVMTTIPAVDLVNSEISDGSIPGIDRISRIYTYNWRYELIEDQYLFKLPRLDSGGLYVTDRFREVVLQNGLEGLLFEDLNVIN